MTQDVTKAEIGEALTGMMRAFDAEYQEIREEDLEGRWFFEFDPNQSIEANMYSFHDLLALYARSCRRWEEIHNGHTCVVERVRDKYIMPKIREFSALLKDEMTKQAEADEG